MRHLSSAELTFGSTKVPSRPLPFGLQLCHIRTSGFPGWSTIDRLIPPKYCVVQLPAGSPLSGVWLERGPFQRILGGVKVVRAGGGNGTQYIIKRDGFVECFWLRYRNRDQNDLHMGRFVSALACVLGIYSLLRNHSNSPAMPAEVSIEILTYRHVGVRHPNQPPDENSPPLAPRVLFDRRTVGENDDFSAVLNESAADLMNAGDFDSKFLPKYAFNDPKP